MEFFYTIFEHRWCSRNHLSCTFFCMSSWNCDTFFIKYSKFSTTSTYIQKKMKEDMDLCVVCFKWTVRMTCTASHLILFVTLPLTLWCCLPISIHGISTVAVRSLVLASLSFLPTWLCVCVCVMRMFWHLLNKGLDLHVYWKRMVIDIKICVYPTEVPQVRTRIRVHHLARVDSMPLDAMFCLMHCTVRPVWLVSFLDLTLNVRHRCFCFLVLQVVVVHTGTCTGFLLCVMFPATLYTFIRDTHL